MSIVDNRKAFHDYSIEDRYEAGVMLEGWEVKAIRDGRVKGAERDAYIGELKAVLFRYLSPLIEENACDFHTLHSKPQRHTIHVNGPRCITFEWQDGSALRIDLAQSLRHDR